VVIFEFLVSCVLPLCVITFTYVLTARHFVESVRSISEGTLNPQPNSSKNTSNSVVGFIVVLISYAPYRPVWTYTVCTEVRDFFWQNYRFFNFSNYKLQCALLNSRRFLLFLLNPVSILRLCSVPILHSDSISNAIWPALANQILLQSDLELTRRNWICNNCLYFLQLQPCCILHTNFPPYNYSNDNENYLALVKCTRSVRKLNILTVICHNNQIQIVIINSFNKVHFTNIPLYFVLQKFLEDIIKANHKSTHILCSSSLPCICFWCLLV
jgi:hypothetical protein